MRPKKKFDICQVKEVTPIPLVHKDGNYGDAVPAVENDKRRSAGFAVSVSCPKIQLGGEERAISSGYYGGFQHYDSALRDTRKMVAKSACASCVFAEMTPVEVSTEIAVAAEAQAAAFRELTALDAARRALEDQTGRSWNVPFIPQSPDKLQ